MTQQTSLRTRSWVARTLLLLFLVVFFLLLLPFGKIVAEEADSLLTLEELLGKTVYLELEPQEAVSIEARPLADLGFYLVVVTEEGVEERGLFLQAFGHAGDQVSLGSLPHLQGFSLLSNAYALAYELPTGVVGLPLVYVEDGLALDDEVLKDFFSNGELALIEFSDLTIERPEDPLEEPLFLLKESTDSPRTGEVFLRYFVSDPLLNVRHFKTVKVGEGPVGSSFSIKTPIFSDYQSTAEKETQGTIPDGKLYRQVVFYKEGLPEPQVASADDVLILNEDAPKETTKESTQTNSETSTTNSETTTTVLETTTTVEETSTEATTAEVTTTSQPTTASTTPSESATPKPTTEPKPTETKPPAHSSVLNPGGVLISGDGTSEKLGKILFKVYVFDAEGKLSEFVLDSTAVQGKVGQTYVLTLPTMEDYLLHVEPDQLQGVLQEGTTTVNVVLRHKDYENPGGAIEEALPGVIKDGKSVTEFVAGEIKPTQTEKPSESTTAEQTTTETTTEKTTTHKTTKQSTTPTSSQVKHTTRQTVILPTKDTSGGWWPGYHLPIVTRRPNQNWPQVPPVPRPNYRWPSYYVPAAPQVTEPKAQPTQPRPTVSLPKIEKADRKDVEDVDSDRVNWQTRTEQAEKTTPELKKLPDPEREIDRLPLKIFLAVLGAGLILLGLGFSLWTVMKKR